MLDSEVMLVSRSSPALAATITVWQNDLCLVISSVQQRLAQQPVACLKQATASDSRVCHEKQTNTVTDHLPL